MLHTELSQTEKNKPIVATIDKIEHSYALIKLSDGTKASLPWSEVWGIYKLHDRVVSKKMDKDEDENKKIIYKVEEFSTQEGIIVKAVQENKEDNKNHREIKEGDKILVTSYDKTFKESTRKSLTLYSHIRAYFNPWDDVVKWKDKEVKSFIVEVVTEKWAYGTIEPGVRAKVALNGIQEILKEKDWHGHQMLLPRDEIAGWFLKDKTDYVEQIVTLDFINFIQSDYSFCDLFDSQNNIENKVCQKKQDDDKEIQTLIKSKSIKTLFLLDDDTVFLESFSDYLKNVCYIDLYVCDNDQNAKEIILDHGDDIDMAIIDVNLAAEKRKDHKGIHVAYYLQERFPKCPIILTTGEEINPKHPEIKKMPSLTIQGIVYKPFGFDSLYRVFNIINNPPFLLSNLFNNKYNSNPSIVEEKCDENIHATIFKLKEETDAEAALLFEINPITDEVKIYAKEGPSDKYHEDKLKLAWSPIRDVAIYGETIFTTEVRREVEYPKHRYLYQAYEYNSCIGVPVRMKRGSYFAYALFVFHPNISHFNKGNDEKTINQASKEIEFDLRLKTYEEEIRKMKPFEMMGQGFGSLAHDLNKNLSADFLLDKIERQLNSKQFDEARQTLQEAKERIINAERIVRSFLDMARGQTSEVESFSVLNECEIILSRINESLKITTKKSLQISSTNMITMRRSGLNQLLTNLILNASQQFDRLPESFTRKKEVHVEITDETDSNGIPWLIIRVHDNGPGIHYSNFKQVFDLNYTTKPNGCGMGLDICKKIAESISIGEIKGNVKVKKSILLCGTTFEVQLPLNMEEI